MNSTANIIIRVYGVIVHNNKVLVTDEFREGMKMTKFPGGGLEQGEGTIDCLKREIEEECNGQQVTNIKHLYTTDFYQKALFYPNHQLISIYYTADLVFPLNFKVSDKAFDFEKMEEGSQSFRWIELNRVKEEEFSFPIDKFVCSVIRDSFA